MSDELKEMLDRLRDYQMTPEERERQEISFAFGNVRYENDRVTRAMVAASLPSSAVNHSDKSG